LEMLSSSESESMAKVEGGVNLVSPVSPLESRAAYFFEPFLEENIGGGGKRTGDAAADLISESQRISWVRMGGFR